MAELKSLIVKGASRFLNGVVADSITATTATISSLQFNNTIFQDEDNFLVIKNSTSKILALKTNGTADFVLRPSSDMTNNIDLGSNTIRWKNLYLSGTAYLSSPLAVSSGGLGVNTLTTDGLLTGNGNGSVTAYIPDWQNWVNGTTAGPQAKIKLGNKDYTSDPIPAATSAISGIITTSTQYVAGRKIFPHGISIMGSSTAGYGVSLYSTGPLEGNLPSHGISFSGTSRFGTHGSVKNGWATYFTSSTDKNRGWIWKLFDTNSITSGNIASLSGYGNLTITNSTTDGPTNAVLNLTKSTTPTEQKKWYYHSTFFIPNTTTGTNFLLLMGKSAESLNSGGINYYYTGVDSSTNNFVSLCLFSGANNILKAYGNKNVDIAGNFLPQTTDTQDIGSNTLKWNNLYLKDSVYIYNTTNTSQCIRLQNINSSGSYEVKIPNYSGHMWLAHVGGASAVGSSTQPVYVDENGRLTAITGALTNGSAYLTNYNHYSNSATQTINLNNDEVAVGAMFHFTVKANVTGSPGVDSTILQMNWANNGGYNSQFGIPTSDNRAFFRRQSAGTWQDWQEIAHGPLNTQVGSSTQPVYLSNTGTITQGTQYAGGTNITLNGVSQGGSIANIYAPTTGATAGYVLQANGSGTNAPTWKPGIYYGTCTATGATKTVNIQDFPSTLVEGQIIYVKFTAAGTTSNITLNVSNTGAKPVYFSSNIATANNYGRYWYANDIVCFVYNKLSENEDCWLVLNAYSYDSYRTRMLYTTAAATATNKHYILGTRTTSSNTAAAVYRAYASNNSSANTSGIYFTGSEGVLYGAAWNDYAEFRHSENSIEAGRVVKELGNGTLELVNERLARGCEIVSDTYGFAIGETDYCQLPTAASGRVLAYPDRDPSTFEIGAPVCSGPNGTVSQMTEEEERLYPSRIIGTVSEIPTYEIWHGGKDVEVNGRIWIRIR